MFSFPEQYGHKVHIRTGCIPVSMESTTGLLCARGFGSPSGNHVEILPHKEDLDFIPANRILSAEEVGLVNVMSRDAVLRYYVNEVKGS